MTEKFVPGDLVKTHQHSYCVYLVVEVKYSHPILKHTELGLVKFMHGSSGAVLCNLGEDSRWTSNTGLRMNGFYKVGSINLKPQE